MTPRFDLIDIIQTVARRRRLVILITLLAAVLGAVGYLLQEKKYKASTEFIISNPMYADRNNFFRTNGDRYVDYFAGEDDIDRVIAISMSDAVKSEVAGRMDLYSRYKLDTSVQKDVFRMGLIWKKHFNVMRTEYKNMELSYTDKDPKLAASVANEAVKVIEYTYRSYYNMVKDGMYRSLLEKTREADSAIALLTDSLAALREMYQIYDIISPKRENVIVGSVKNNGRKDFGWGMEQIQNVESVKDEWVTERTRFLGLLNEFSTGTRPEELSFIRVLTTAVPPVRPVGLGLVLTTAACALAGLFLSVLIVLLNAWLRAVTSVRR